jgi:hypothetical protein
VQQVGSCGGPSVRSRRRHDCWPGLLLSRAAALHAVLSDAEGRYYRGSKLDLQSFCKPSAELRLMLMSVGIAECEAKRVPARPLSIEQHAERLGVQL